MLIIYTCFMSKSIYQTQLDSLLKEITADEKHTAEKPSLLLHACCGPCSSYVLEYLAQIFDITVLYYNPNIFPPEEYERRLSELKNFYTKFPPVLQNNVKVIECNYDPEEFYAAVGTRENPELAKEAERGERCRRCYELRLRYSFDYALRNNFDWFCTTLSISPFKDAEKINVIGEQLCSSFEKDNPSGKYPKWLPSDFKKKSGFLRSLELSEEYGLYRQQYCGCVYSKQNKEIHAE